MEILFGLFQEKGANKKQTPTFNVLLYTFFKHEKCFALLFFHEDGIFKHILKQVNLTWDGRM